MNYTIVHHDRAASPEAARTHCIKTRCLIKLGVDIHQQSYMVVAQHGHEHPKPPRKFSPPEFVSWIAKLLAAGHQVAVVYESCGFGFDLYRRLQALGAACYVISPQKLDENGSRVKTDGRDARTLCLRLSRYWVSTVGKNEAAVRRYIQEQEKEDKRLEQMELTAL